MHSRKMIRYRDMPYLSFSVLVLSMFFFYLYPEKRVWFLSGGIILAIIPLVIYYRGCKSFVSQTILALKNIGEGETGEINDPMIRQLADYASLVLADRYQAQYAEEMSDKRSELSALQRQINPHFLYNTLDSIRGEALICGNESVAEMTEALAMIFRYSISNKGNIVTISDELKNIKYYLLIQQFRFEDRFKYLIECEKGAEDYCIPKLSIQPFIENALFHGLENKSRGGLLRISIVTTDRRVEIQIEDNGTGIDADTLEQIRATLREKKMNLSQSEKGTGIAIANVNERIQLAFGQEYGVNIYSELGSGTIVILSLPKRKTMD